MCATKVDDLPLFAFLPQEQFQERPPENVMDTRSADVSRSQDLLSRITEVVGGDPLWRVLGNVFDEMEWVEDEIARAKERWPQLADRIDRLFGLRTRSVVPPGMWTERLARLHIRELAERIANGGDLRPPTLAEKLFVIAETSFVAPFGPKGFVLYARLFREAFPEEAEQIFGEKLPIYETSVLNEEVEALHAGLIRKLYRRDRTLEAKS